MKRNPKKARAGVCCVCRVVIGNRSHVQISHSSDYLSNRFLARLSGASIYPRADIRLGLYKRAGGMIDNAVQVRYTQFGADPSMRLRYFFTTDLRAAPIPREHHSYLLRRDPLTLTGRSASHNMLETLARDLAGLHQSRFRFSILFSDHSHHIHKPHGDNQPANI